MTPEKNSSIRKEVKKAKSKVAKNFFQVSLATSMILGAPACVPTETISTIPTGETSPRPNDSTKTVESPTEATYEVTSTPGIESTINPPTEVATEMPTASPTPEPTVNPDIEIVDEELAENIKNLMPEMWFYNDVSKKFEVRNSDEFNFLISKKTKLLIFDKDGNEVGFANYFVKTHPDAEMTDYFSLTDISRDTIIPIRLYSEMGDFTSESIGSVANATTKQCMFGFVEEYTEFKMNYLLPQEAVDISNKYAPDTGNIQKGEKMLEAAILKVLANITNKSEEKLLEDFKYGISIELETNKGKWIVDRGINYIWSDTQSKSYEILDGELFLFNGMTSIDSGNDPIEGCNPMSWDVGFRSFLGDNFTEAVEIYKFNSLSLVDRETIQIPVILGLRKD